VTSSTPVLDPTVVPRRRRDTRVRRYRGRLFVANSADAFELNRTAELVFRHADGEHTLGQIAERVGQVHGLSAAVALAETSWVLAVMVRHSILTTDD
jgi:pyrroloquinoline quinone biosynthesis protein D